MHFTYDTQLCKTELMQGDVLARTTALNKILQEVHPHFYQNSKNLFFMVLTQSCDLVSRVNGSCKALYITLAPVRSLDLVVEKHLSQFLLAGITAELPVIGAKAKTKASEFLQRLFNNNESGYFFLDSEDTSLDSDCVAFLNLSIPIRSGLHLKTCLDAKQLQLEATFQAKLGWLVGQMYSRVGTPDWDQSVLTKKVRKVLQESAIWVDDSMVSVLEEEFKARASETSEARMTKTEIARLVAKTPSRKQLILREVARVIGYTLGPDQKELAERLRKRLEGDAGLSTFLK